MDLKVKSFLFFPFAKKQETTHWFLYLLMYFLYIRHSLVPILLILLQNYTICASIILFVCCCKLECKRSISLFFASNHIPVSKQCLSPWVLEMLWQILVELDAGSSAVWYYETRNTHLTFCFSPMADGNKMKFHFRVTPSISLQELGVVSTR